MLTGCLSLDTGLAVTGHICGNTKFFFLTNNENHKLDTRQRNNLYLPQANLNIYQKGTYYSGIQIFNSLPLQIRGGC